MKFNSSQGVVDAPLRRLIVAGWTARDRAAVDHHIEELAAIGVAPPSEVPLFYQVAADLLTPADRIEALGPETSGEAEPLLVHAGKRMWLGLASDHTDRALEAYSVAHSKQIAAKPCASELWAYDEVEDHLDQLVLRSWIEEEGAETLYQEGPLSGLLPLCDLAERAGLTPGMAMLCGTMPAIGGVRAAPGLRMELHDPVLGRTISHAYRVEVLDIVN